MAYLWEVTEALSLLCETQENEETVNLICQKALDEINSKLKPDADLTDPRITSAAAAGAFYALAVKSSNNPSQETLSDFKAGDLSISFDNNKSSFNQLEIARELRDNALKELVPLLKDNGFYFGSVLV